MSYVTKAVYYCPHAGDNIVALENVMAISEERPPRYTGLVDQNGTAIYHVDDRQPPGFRIKS